MIAKSLEPMLQLADRFCHRFVRDTKGQDLIEYALLVGFVAIAAMAFFPTNIGPSIMAIFTTVTGQLGQAATGS